MSAAVSSTRTPLLVRVQGLLNGDLFPIYFLLALMALGILWPWLPTVDPLAPNPRRMLELPSWEFPLGTDDLGRDMLGRLVLGARLALTVGCGAAFLALVTGGALGLLAGYRQGLIGAVIMRCSDVLLAFPAILLAMLVATVLETGSLGVLLAIAIVSAPAFVRLAQAVMLSQRHRQYVEAAVAFGASQWYVIFRAVLPNVLAPLAVQTAFATANAVLLEAGLSFLGLGIQPPTASLGLMLRDARGYLRTDPWFGICPGLLIILIVLALNAAADALGRRIDPRNVARQMRNRDASI